jgi:hypothetical protein
VFIRSRILTGLLLAAPITLLAMAQADSHPPSPHALGSLELRVAGIGTNPRITTERASGLTDSQNGLQIKPVGTGALEYKGTRYLYARFRVRNADENGKAYPTAQSDLALVATGLWGAGGTIAGTAVSKIARADGSDYADSPALQKTIARAIQPTHAMMLVGGQVTPIPGEADFVAFTEAEVNPKNFTPPTTLEGLESSTIFPYGYAVRCVEHCAQGPRTLPANPAPDQFDGAVTVAVKLPKQTNPKDDPVAFNLRLEVLGGNPTRVTLSPEEGLDLGPALERVRTTNAKAVLAIGSGQRRLDAEQARALARIGFPTATGFQGIANLRTADPDPNPAPGDPVNFAQVASLLPDPQSLPTFALPGSAP